MVGHTEMSEVRVTTKPDGFGRSWLETGKYEVDAFERKVWRKDRSPAQDRRLKVHREYAGRAGGEVINWIIEIPEGYPLSIAKITFDRINPKEVEILWSPEAAPEADPQAARYRKIHHALELAQGNAELTTLLRELFDAELQQV